MRTLQTFSLLYKKHVEIPMFGSGLSVGWGKAVLAGD